MQPLPRRLPPCPFLRAFRDIPWKPEDHRGTAFPALPECLSGTYGISHFSNAISQVETSPDRKGMRMNAKAGLMPRRRNRFSPQQ
jgi:hypothetical protein